MVQVLRRGSLAVAMSLAALLLAALTTATSACAVSLSPEDFGARGDGITDDTAAWIQACAAIAKAGGGSIGAGNNRVYLVYATQPLRGLSYLCRFATPINEFRLDMNGSAFLVGHAFSAATQDLLYLFSFLNPSDVVIEGLRFAQVHPIHLPASPAIGTFGVGVDHGGSNITLIKPSCEGGAGVANFDGDPQSARGNSSGVVISDFRAEGCVYGVTFPDGGSEARISGLSDRVERTYFAYGVSRHRVSIISRNALANDVLIVGGGVTGKVRPTSDIDLDYTVLPNTANKTAASYFNIYTHTITTVPEQGAILRNIRVHLNLDLAGVERITPAVLITKASSDPSMAILENIDITGTIKNVPAFSGYLIDLFSASAAPWIGEHARNLRLNHLTVLGSAKPAMYIDLDAMAHDAPLVLKDVVFPGPYIERSFDGANRLCERVHFPALREDCRQ